jgi:hypothetical protein
VPKSDQAFHGKQSALPQIEDELCAYVMDLKCGYVVSTEMLQLEASRIAPEFSIPVTEFRIVTGRFNSS